MRISNETELLMTKEQKEALPELVARLKHGWPRFTVSEGVKYVVHLGLAELIPSNGDNQANWGLLVKELGCDGFFQGTICGRPATVFFFMPLFE